MLFAIQMELSFTQSSNGTKYECQISLEAIKLTVRRWVSKRGEDDEVFTLPGLNRGVVVLETTTTATSFDDAQTCVESDMSGDSNYKDRC